MTTPIREAENYSDPRTISTKINGILVDLVSSYIRNKTYADYDKANKAIQALLAKHIEQATQETERAYGGCHKCYGKGYATTHEGHRSFDGFNYHESAKTTHIKYCTCSRGEQLKEVTERAVLEGRIDEIDRFFDDNVEYDVAGRLQTLKTQLEAKDERN